MKYRSVGIGFVVATLTLVLTAVCPASEIRMLRLGYVADPRAALCLVGAELGLFRRAGLEVDLFRFTDSEGVLEALAAGRIDAGALPSDQALKAIARGEELRIIAGGGSATNPESTGNGNSKEEPAIVVLVPGRLSSPAEKRAVTRLTAGLIRAYRILARQTDDVWRSVRLRTGTALRNSDFIFDPNPDYWRLERLWQRLGLSDPAKPRDYLADRVYEEIYCDALDQILAECDLRDPVVKELFERAVCVPNCCPANSGRPYTTLQGGSSP